MRTFIQVTDLITEIASNHRQINSVGRGDQWEIATSGVVNYPMFWAVPQGTTVGKGQIGYKFQFIVMDLVQIGEGNETDVLSDTHQILTDVLTDIKFGQHDEIDLDQDTFNSSQFTEKFDDVVSGWTCDVTIWTPFAWGTCSIPYITPPTSGSGVSTVWNVANGGTGISSYTVGDILYANSTTTLAKLGIGSAGQVLTVASGLPSWAAAAAGSGTVTSVSVVTANGFTGTVATATTTPAITLTTSITGVLKGDGTAISAATDADINGKLLTGYVSGAGTLAATDTILQGFNKLNGNIAALVTGVSSVNSATGAVTLTHTTAQGVSGAWTGTALSLTLGALTGVTSFNGLVVTANTGVVTTGTWQGTSISTTYTDAKVKTVTGGTSITIGGTSTDPTFAVNTSWVGQSAITTLGTITTGTWNGSLIPLAYGGTNKNMTASNGGIVYTDADSMEVLSATATAGQMLRSGASTAPTWSTNTFPNTTGEGEILYATSANVISSASDFVRLTTGQLLVGYSALAVAEVFGVQKNQNGATYQAITNTTSGTAGYSALFISNSSTIATSISLRSHSALFTTSGINVADTGVLTCSKAAGLNIGTPTATQLSFWTNDTERARFLSTGELILGGTAVISSELVSIQKAVNAGTGMRIYNSTSGTSASSWCVVQGNTATVQIYAISPAYTTSGMFVADTAVLASGAATTGGMNVGTRGAHQLSFWTNDTKKITVPSAGGLVVGTAALATNATAGFLYIPTCAGTPTGVPTTQTGTVAMIFDTTNNKLYIYDGSWLGGTTPGAFV